MHTYCFIAETSFNLKKEMQMNRNHSIVDNFETFSSKFELQTQSYEQTQTFLRPTKQNETNAKIHGKDCDERKIPKSKCAKKEDPFVQFRRGLCARFFDIIPAYYYQTQCRRLRKFNNNNIWQFHHCKKCEAWLLLCQPFELPLVHHRCHHKALLQLEHFFVQTNISHSKFQ